MTLSEANLPNPLESTPLITIAASDSHINKNSKNEDKRMPLFLFLEAETPNGLHYESFTIFLILLSIVTFILSTLFLPEYNSDSPIVNSCGSICDAIWFGNYRDNALSGLGIGATSICEIIIVGIFSIDYLLRLYTADLLDPIQYRGVRGRIRFVFSFFSLVDLASTVPFYVDSFLLKDTDLASSIFLRMFRFLRMMRVEGRYDLALGMVDDVFREQRGVLGTALFVGFTVWGVLSSFFYLAERGNYDMIYCGAAPERCFDEQDDVDTSLCAIDNWGVVDCTEAGCTNGNDGKEVCWNLYRSIVDSSFWTLMELFGEFPLVDQHSFYGKILGTFTAIFAVAVFALPVGIFGSGFEDQIARRREEKKKQTIDIGITKGDTENDNGKERASSITGVIGDTHTFRGRLYNFLNRQDTLESDRFDRFIHLLILGSVLLFMFDTVGDDQMSEGFRVFLSVVEFITVVIFTFEYFLRLYAAREDANYRGFNGIVSYVFSFYPIIDLLAIAPYWIDIISLASGNPSSKLVKFLRLLRVIRFEKYMNLFTFFDDALRENVDILAVTGFSATLLWIFFSSVLYFTERNSADDEMANYYKTVPQAMWITLLNLSGECPLANYSAAGKVVLGFIGLFATAVFGVPIGILGAGFEEIVASRVEDSPDQEDGTNGQEIEGSRLESIEGKCYQFVNGIGSKPAFLFEVLIYLLIGTTVAIGIIQTVPGHEDTLAGVEWLAVIIFTIEYIIRFIGAGADQCYTSNENVGFIGALKTRAKFVVSFYSIIDLMAVVPFYLAYMMPGSWVDEHDEYLRMLRLCRLLKLDKYVPSISLVDDVLRLKRRSLVISCFAAGILWILFSGLMYLAEHEDYSMSIDNLPLYGCVENCTMSVRYENFFTSLPLVGIHLTGDFPMVEYDSFGRIVCFFMVIAAIGVVSIPSGIVASGFAEIVQSKAKRSNDPNSQGNNAGDDWFDIRYRELEGQVPPPSIFGPKMDSMQYAIKSYLDGEVDGTTGMIKKTTVSKCGRALFFALIVTNIIAVVLESIPELDKYVGNQPGNFFDVFEAWSVFFFTIDYILRLISARKSREALYSPWVYATTFFGIVDLMSIAPWYVQIVLSRTGNLKGDEAKIFRIFRIFRILQLEDFIIAFSKLDNVFRASKDVLKATGLMAIIIWVGSSALFFIFEKNNPNFRQCDASIPLVGNVEYGEPGCYDFESTSACNEYYPGMCSQSAFTNMPNTMFYVAVFLGGDWGFVDFTWPGKLVCMFLCIAGIALYSVPVGTLFDSFGAVLGLSDDDDEQDGEEGNIA